MVQDFESGRRKAEEPLKKQFGRGGMRENDLMLRQEVTEATCISSCICPTAHPQCTSEQLRLQARPTCVCASFSPCLTQE